MGSIPNGSAPLSSMRSPDLYTTLPGRTGKAQVRLAAAGRLRTAVALELVAGKVRALLDTVRTLVGTAPVTVRAHPAWVRSHDLAAGIGSHHACGRMGAASVLGRLGFRPKGPAQAPPSGRRKGGPAGWTSSPGTNPPTA
jgi:hypothetical protein